MMGGKAHVKFHGEKILPGIGFDDVDLNLIFDSYGTSMDGLFDINVQYSFVQKRESLTDLQQEGYFTLYRTLDDGRWKTMMTVHNNHLTPQPFLILALESDWWSFLRVSLAFLGRTWRARAVRQGQGRFLATAWLPGQIVVGEVRLAGDQISLMHR